MDRVKADDLIDRYLEDCEVRGMAVGSLPRYKSALRIFQGYMAERGIETANRWDLVGFIRYLRRTARPHRRLSRLLSTLSAFMSSWSLRANRHQSSPPYPQTLPSALQRKCG